VPPAHERIERWALPDGDEVSVARLAARWPDAPTLAILHGLEGTVRSTYAQGLMHQARQRGWGAAMLIFRTCDGRMPRVPRMYHSGETTDADLFLRRLVDERPHASVMPVGVSLGANVLLKWLGEQGRNVPSQIRRAAAVSTPFDLAEGAAHLEHGFSRLYVRHFVRSLRRKAMAAMALHPGLPVDVAKLAAASTFFEFDDAFTAPVHGFNGAHDYYARSSSLGFLPRIATPVLLLSARNDPFLPPQVLEEVRTAAERNPKLHLDFRPFGGHVGFVAGPPWRPRYFMEERVAWWFDQTAFEARGD
jgi:predicted alpha/beta-fold hydrolase